MIKIKKIILILKKVVYAFLLLFGLNLSIRSFGINIPINEANIAITALLGAPGLLSIFIIKIILF